MTELKDYYYILGLEQSATLEEIKSAYKKLSKKFHPDLNDNDEFFKRRFQEIQEAYEILGNNLKKQQYDAKRNYAFEPEFAEENYASAQNSYHSQAKPNYTSSNFTNKAEDERPSSNFAGSSSSIPKSAPLEKYKGTIFTLVQDLIVLNPEFYNTFLKRATPPFLYLILWLDGVSVFLYPTFGEQEKIYDVPASIFWLGVAIVGGFFVGWLGYQITGSIQSLFIRLSGGERDAKTARNLWLYSSLPQALIVIFLFIFNGFYLDSNSVLSFTPYFIAAAILSNIYINFRGIMMLHKPKLLPTAFFFIVYPALFWYNTTISTFFQEAVQVEHIETTTEAIEELNTSTYEEY